MKKLQKKVATKKSNGIKPVVSKSLFLAVENNLTNEERIAVRVLNFIAEFDGIIVDESEREYLLKRGIERFIGNKRQHLVRVTETAYPIRIVVAKNNVC